MVQGGTSSGDATVAVFHVVNRATRHHDSEGLFFQVLELLFNEGRIEFDQHDDQEVSEAFRRIRLAAPEGDDTYCETNDCEEPTCHRCFTREGCGLHEKCRDFARRGETEFVARHEALRAMRWMILMRALNDGSGGWGGPDLSAIGDEDPHAVWVGWVRNDAFANADEVSQDRLGRTMTLLEQGVNAAWEENYAEALRYVTEADRLMDGAPEDEFVCSRCERTRYDRGNTSCGECGERFCLSCDTAGGSHPGAHSCYGNCTRCFASLAEPSEKNDWYDGDLCEDCRAKDEGEDEDAESNPYYGRAGSGLMIFSPDGRRVLLTLRSDEVEEPGTWGVPGGKLDGKDLYASALREVREELGSVPQHVLFDRVVYEDDGFRYTTFLARLDESAGGWSPRLNWESDDADWFDVQALPDDLHFGVEHVVKERPALFTGASHDEDVARAGRANPRRPRR